MRDSPDKTSHGPPGLLARAYFTTGPDCRARRYIDIENGYTETLKQVYDATVDIERAIGASGR